MPTCDIAIVGAGPYGLSAAAHLNANGVNVRVFGETMSFWNRNMPEGMRLRSPWEASQLSDPARSLTIEAFQTATGVSVSRPIPIECFVAYGRWFQSHAVPNLEQRKVVEIEKDTAGFRVALTDGEVVRCGRVIVAGGIGPFAARPPQFAGIPRDLASHSSEHRDLARFRGQRVVVIGGGQSALESAALLHERQAEVELVVRESTVRWTWQRPWLHTFRPVGMLLYAWPDVGPAFISHAVARPNLYRLFPRCVQDSWRVKSIRPNGVGWLKPRLCDVSVSTGRSVLSATARGNQVELKLSDGSDRLVDHVLMATGYRIDVRKYEFLSGFLRSSLRLIDGHPVLGQGFESSIPGLHFLGAPAAWSYGPLMRFVAGADFAAGALTLKIVGKAGQCALMPHSGQVLEFEKAPKVTIAAAGSTDSRGRSTHWRDPKIRRKEAVPMSIHTLGKCDIVQPGRSLPTTSSSIGEVHAGRNGIGAVVMGGDYRGLGVVRSLGRRGIPVWVLHEGGQLLATASRYAQRILPWLPGDDAERVGFLLDLAAKNGLERWVLIPTGDESAALVARHHAELAERYRLTTPHWDILRWAYDKRLTYQLADELQVSHPWTLYPSSRRELAEANCPFPVILKPAFRNKFNRLTAAKAWRVDDRQSLLARYDKACALIDPELLMVQEVIPGWGEAQFSYAAICQDGRSLTSLVARRLRQFPMDFGRASTCVETVDERAVIEPSICMLEAMKFTGIVEIEFKHDTRDRQYKLLDINPRVWGWHSIGGRAGVDFSYLLWLQACGAAVPESRPQIGVRWVRTSTDLRTVILEILRGRLSLGEYARSLRRPRESAIFSPDDPLPGLLELPLLAYLLGRRVFRGGKIA